MPMDRSDLDSRALLSQACADVVCMTGLLAEETESVAAGDIQAVMRVAAHKGEVAERVAADFAEIDRRIDVITADHMPELLALSELQAALATAAERNMAAVANGRAAASSALALLTQPEAAPLEFYGRNGGIGRGQVAPAAVDLRF